MIETAGDLVTFALRASGLNGTGQTPSAEDANTGLQLLRMMLAQWQRKRWLVPSLADTALASTGAASYTVGATGNFAIARPDRLDAAYARLLATSGALSVDYGLAIIEAREDYSGIVLKGLSTFPGAVFYESSYPLGVLHFWPVPPAGQFELHIVTKGTLPTYATLTDALDLPPEYLEALMWSLCVRLQMSYGLTARPDHVGAMRAALNTIRQANTQVPLLAMPAGLGGRAQGMGGLMVGQGFGRAFILDGPSVLT